MTRNIIAITTCVVTVLAGKSIALGQTADDSKLPGRITAMSGVPTNESETSQVRVLFSSDNGDEVAGLEGFLSAHPDSAWAPSIHAALADVYRFRGRNSLSINHWKAAWDRLKAATA